MLFSAHVLERFAHGVRRAQAGGGTARRMPRGKRSVASFLNRASHGSSRRPVRAATLRAKAFRKAHIKKTWFPPFLPRELWRFSLFSEKCGCGVCFAFTFAWRFTTSPVIAQICVRFVHLRAPRDATLPIGEGKISSRFPLRSPQNINVCTVSPHFPSRRKRSFYSYLTRDRNSKFQTPNSTL